MSKKLFFLGFIFIFIIGCSKKETIQNNVHTIIEENNNMMIGINYPLIGNKKFDQKIQKQVDTIYDQFKDHFTSFNTIPGKSELNIDYTFYQISNHYINIALYTFIDHPHLVKPDRQFTTYTYDLNKNQFLSLKQIIDPDSYDNVISIVQQELRNTLKKEQLQNITIESFDNFTFNDNQINLYLNDETKVSLPITLFKWQIDFHKNSKKVTYSMKNTEKTIDPKKPTIAITFDDGPSKYTKSIIDTLKKQNINATFFVLGNKVQMYSETLHQAIINGNELGNHSYNHKLMTKLSEQDLLEQINQTQDIIKNKLNYTPTLVRPTYGAFNDRMKQKLGLKMILWTVDTKDWKYKNIDQIVKRATNKVKDGDIILMHDTHERTSKALEKIIPILKEKGFQFVTVSELEEIKMLRKTEKSNE